MTDVLEAPTVARARPLLRRQLRAAETAIDILKLDQALNQAKNELDRILQEELVRAAKMWQRTGRFTVQVPDTALDVMQRLRRLGQQEALLELTRLGYRPRVRSFVDSRPTGPGDLGDYVRRNLGPVAARVESDLVRQELGGAPQAALIRAVMRVPGGRDIASRVVSTALISGMGQTWEQNQDIVHAWEYTAVLDAGTCPACAPLDGTRYQSLDELFAVLPNFGPNPNCHGGGRCRCRAVPAPAGEAPRQVPAAADPIRQAVSLPSRSIHGDTLGEMTDTRDAIERVVGQVNAHMPVPSRIRNIADAEAHYVRRGTDPVEIVVDPSGAHPGLSFAHEIGHYLDHQAIGTPRDMASELADPQLSPWFDAVNRTREIRTLRALFANRNATIGAARVPVDRGYVEYLLRNREIFARSFAQWIAIRSEDPVLLAQLDDLRTSIYPSQWDDSEFDPIASALDELARRMGWTP